MMKIRLLFFLLFFVSILHAQNYALSFNGSTDYVDCGNNFNPNSIRTMECWVKFNDLTADQEILSKSNINEGIELLVYSNNLSVYCMYDANNVSYINYPIANLSTGVWYHLAFTWNGTKESMQLYVDDHAVGSRTDIGDINATGLTNPAGTFKIGEWSYTSDPRALNGMVDEVRIWNTTRTASEIKNGMYGTLATGTPGLLAYYNMNEGTGTTATNSATSTSAIAGSNGALMNGVTWTTSPVQWSDNALYFDGVDDYVAAPANTNYDFTTGTIECWVRPDGFNGNSTIIATRDAFSTRYSFHMSANQIGLWNGDSWMPIDYNTFNIGQWYHLAFVCTPTATTIYVNGEPIGTTGNVVGNATELPLQIGMAFPTATGEQFIGAIDEVRIWNTARTQEQIQANMNYSLTGTEADLVGLFSFNQGIAAGTNSGLVTAVDRTSLNNHATLNNFALTGTTSNYIGRPTTDLILPVELLSFSATKKSKSIQLNWSTASESNSDRFEVEKSIDGIHFTKIATIKAAGTSTQKHHYSTEDLQPANGMNFYRLKQIDQDGKWNYYKVISVKWNANAIPVVTFAPQPLHSSMTVKITGDFSKSSFVIYDMHGRQIKHYPINTAGSNAVFEVNRGGLSSGIYFYKLFAANGTIIDSGKIVVE